MMSDTALNFWPPELLDESLKGKAIEATLSNMMAADIWAFGMILFVSLISLPPNNYLTLLPGGPRGRETILEANV